MRKTLVSLCVSLSLPLALGACRRPQPSPEFDHASRAFTSLYAQKLDEAYLDPGIPEIESELHRVNAKSADAAQASELLTRIDNGRTAQLKIQADREAASVAARTAPANTAFTSAPTDSAREAPRAAPDAGSAPADHPSAGMSFAEFERRFGDCFDPAGPINVVGQGMRDSFGLKDLTACRQQHPGFEGLLVVADGRALVGVFPRSAVFNNAPVADGGTAPGGAAAPR